MGCLQTPLTQNPLGKGDYVEKHPVKASEREIFFTFPRISTLFLDVSGIYGSNAIFVSVTGSYDIFLRNVRPVEKPL